MRDKLAILALVLGTLGFICLAYSLLLPRWYVSASERDMDWMDLWMECHWDVERQCGLHVVFFYVISIPLCIGTTLALSALLISGFAMRGSNCCGTNCFGDNTQKMLSAGGLLYLISCLLTLGPVIWTTHILSHARPRNIGECLYLAWVSLGLLMAAGVLQLHRYSPCRRNEEVSQNCTPPLEHEGEEEWYGENGESVCETAQQEMVCLNKYERTPEDSLTEPV